MGVLVDAARVMLGTKWRHRGRSVHGVDCAGLVVLAYRNCGFHGKDYTLYGRQPNRDNALIDHATAALGDPLPPETLLEDGDVVIMRFDIEPHHMAIVAAVTYAGTPAFNIIHSDGHVGRVLEQRLTPDMKARITHIYRRAP